MDKFQELVDKMQDSIVQMLNDFILIVDSERKTDEEKLKMIKDYAKENRSVIIKDKAIHEGKIIELDASGKHF